MILLAELTNPRAAQAFFDYLKTQHITAKLMPKSAQRVEIWVDEAHHAKADVLWHEFEQDSSADKYWSASWDVGTTDSGLAYQGASFDLKARFDALSWLNRSVSLVSVGLYLAFMFGGFNSLFSVLKFNPANPLQWFTPAIIHFSAIHLIFNLMWWMSLGSKIEQALSSRHLVFLFLFTALISNWAQFLLVGDNFGGLSGVVYGLLGFCWIYGYYSKNEQLAVSQPIIGFMLVWLALGFADVLFVSMANWAHLFGLIAGCVAGWALAWQAKK
ncbi:rhomboid family intramembrane serine protease GlpG [Pseudoalteromonas tunicata]|uniref:rhomboid family intramembrane serine protease GlpG n=1 Tax=Pseudoalteromonas tunicata TaxID=314281 RepID=UPI00273EC542|nr:rhomboid family intramembrane serine protease GlpG [Pseudoalteromonas tunicata]MDP5214348.1 rhomboid family intramembrane serine protease GlpG [Pseudoalteromonas tunicata]